MQYNNPFVDICLEGSTSLLRGLGQADKEILYQHHTVANFRKGDIIINHGARLKGLICLASGKAKVFRIGAGNREQIIKMLRPMNFISYRSLVSDSTFTFTVVAIEESATVTFERNAFSGILKQNGELAARFIKVISDDLLHSENRIISLTQKHVRGRMAESILLLCETYGTEPDGKTLSVMLSREDIAHLSNMTTSNAIRTLSGFVSEKILDIEGRKIMILDPAALKAISESGQ